MDGVIGIYVVGSATRPYRDELSEDDVYERTPMDERQVFSFKDGELKIVDYEFYLIPWTDFVKLTESAHDMFHHSAQHAVILHDPEGRIERRTIHFLELLYRLGRAQNSQSRRVAHQSDVAARGCSQFSD